MTQVDHWERHAEEWVRWAREPEHDSYWRFHRDRFLELLPPPGRLTLDVGCGEGRLTRDLKTLGHRVIGVDASATMVQHARSEDPELEVVQGDATALPLDDGAADLAIAFMSLINIEALPEAVREVARVLRPGGRFCIAVLHPLATLGGFGSERPDAPLVLDRSYFEPFVRETAVERGGLAMTFADIHRPLEAYVEALADAAFLLERLREVPDTSAVPTRWQRFPLFLHIRALQAGVRSS